MSTITTGPRPPTAPSMAPAAPEEERGVMRGVSWNLYDRLTDAIGERSSIRVAFDGKDVEIMVVGPVHEGVGRLLDLFVSLSCRRPGPRFLSAWCDDLEAAGGRAWARADVSYCFDPAKVATLPGGHSRGLMTAPHSLSRT